MDFQGERQLGVGSLAFTGLPITKNGSLDEQIPP